VQVVDELPTLVEGRFGLDPSRRGITGHSMGGHGALTIALKNPDRYRSESAFAPIVAPTEVPWGQKAFTGYLGDDPEDWVRYDACKLASTSNWQGRILIDQGDADGFLQEQLQPDRFVEACGAGGIELLLRMQPGYDHSYYFIASLFGEHVAHHARVLRAE